MIRTLRIALHLTRVLGELSCFNTPNELSTDNVTIDEFDTLLHVQLGCLFW
jgi:hypothetical protein